jgi:hypothetical protein
MIKYAYSYFAHTYFSFYHARIMKMLSVMCKVLALSTLEGGYWGSSYRKSLVEKENFISHNRLCVR